ncbi:restriction endonuclease subunit S [Streptomyces albidoflavus]|uniref:restriction endonuclease subunit S n=1 Tax=Streptomyces albidoflavus TaxID=1886 RepID=UPI00101E5D3C|nr:restriction endonuclease subunit S [Streptomyces albidoflavus]RZD82057.1 hypothetical protein C0Q63_21605 [Streptomyces albidoflavus]
MSRKNWESRSLGDLASFASGKTPPRSRQAEYFDAGEIPWVKTMDLNNGRISRTSECITSRAVSDTKIRIHPPGTVLIAMYGGFGQIGRTGILCTPAATNQAITAILPDPDILDSRYLLHFLNYKVDYWRTVASSSRKDPNITKADVVGFPVELPSLNEQQEISEALDDAEEKILFLRQLIAKKQEVKQGLMQQLLTGRTRLPGFTESWSTRSLCDLLTYEQPGRYLVKATKQLAAGRVPVLTAGKTFVLGFTNELYGVYQNHPVVIFDDFTTASKYVDFDFKAKSSAMKILSPKEGVNLRFIYERMQLIDFPLGDHKRYWISEYSKQELLVPSEEEQAAVAQVLADVDHEIDALKVRFEKARSVKQGMMQELLTGRTRLPVQGEDDE